MMSLVLSILGKAPKRLLVELAVLAVLLFTIFSLFNGYQREKGERMRFENNQAVLLAQIHTYKVSDSLNAARVDALTLTVDEFRKNFKEQASLIKEMGVKLNRVLSYTSLATETTNNITTTVRDSLVLREAPTTLQVIQHSDKWLTLDGYIENREFHGRVVSRDSIEQVVHRVPRKFLFIKYGTKGIRQDIVSKNPNTEISYLRYIEFGKRKRGR